MQDTRIKYLSNKQKGICKICKRPFYWNDLIEVDHIIPRHLGGSEKMINLQALHRHCHDSKTALEKSKNKSTPSMDIAIQTAPSNSMLEEQSKIPKSLWMTKPKKAAFKQKQKQKTKNKNK
jgi:hypothetical protein